MSQTGFIILRHIMNESTNNYWMHCYDCIRLFYPEYPIVIIDDNSDYKYISDKVLYKTTVINSEFVGRGELLPYYYYLTNKFFDTAIIIHDSVFINSHMDFTVNTYKLIWEFEHDWDQVDDETRIIKIFNDVELLDFYNKKKLWKGCFGGMSVITHDFLNIVNTKYDISKLLCYVLNRHNRCSFERVIACLLQIVDKNISLLGNIHKYCEWGILYCDKDEHNELPIIKVWTGR